MLTGALVRVVAIVVVDDGLDRVPEQLADDVLEVAEDVGEGRLEVALDSDLGHLHVRAVGGAREVPHRAAAPLDHVLGHALEEDLANELRLGERRPRLEPVGVERLGERQVLLRYDPAGYALWVSDFARLDKRALHT